MCETVGKYCSFEYDEGVRQDTKEDMYTWNGAGGGC